MLIYNASNELLSINCRITDLILLFPNKYKTLIISNELFKTEAKTRIDQNVFNSKFRHEPVQNAQSLSSTGTRSTMNNQINKDSNIEYSCEKYFAKSNIEELNKSNRLISKNNNNYINITEDYKLEQNKNLPSSIKNFSVSSTFNNHSTLVEDKKKSNLNIQVTRNIPEQRMHSETDLKIFKLDNYLPNQRKIASKISEFNKKRRKYAECI